MSAAPEIVDNPGESRFEVSVDGHRAELVYHRSGRRFVLVHTEVPDALEGRGIGGRLVEFAVARAAELGAVVVPRCPFARGWLERHPDAASRVEIDWSDQ